MIYAQQFVGKQVIWGVLNEAGQAIFLGAWHTFCQHNDKYILVSAGPRCGATEITSSDKQTK